MRDRARELLASVQRVECVPIEYPFSDREADPIWRIELDGFCADFDFEAAAQNFTNAINGRIEKALSLPRSPEDGEGIVSEIAAERRRQIEVEGWSPEHDDEHECGALARAAAAYSYGAVFSSGERDFVRVDYTRSPVLGRLWPWTASWWKPKDRRRDLIRAAALIIAEIERLDRAALSSPSRGTGR